MRIVGPLIVVALIFLTGCGASVPSQDDADTSNATIIRMLPTGFEPDTVTVKSGARVCFVNEDTQARWPASNIHPTHEIYSEFDPKGPVATGDTWCFRFGKAGVWKLHDHLYPEFVGTVNAE